MDHQSDSGQGRAHSVTAKIMNGVKWLCYRDIRHLIVIYGLIFIVVYIVNMNSTVGSLLDTTDTVDLAQDLTPMSDSASELDQNGSPNLVDQNNLASTKIFHGGRHLITTVFKGTYHDERFQEILHSLILNLKNIYFDHIHVLWEDVDPTEFIRPNLTAISLEHLLDKLVLTKVNKQPTYQEMFQYANKFLLRGTLAIIANGDIYFDQTLQCILPLSKDGPNFQQPTKVPPRLLAITRRPSQLCPKGTPEGWTNKAYDTVPVRDLCITYTGSHDAFAFAPPVKENLIRHLKFTQNVGLGAENKLIWEFQRAGYRVLNPCRMVRAFHLHCSNERHYRAKTKSDKKWRLVSSAEMNKGVEKFGTAEPDEENFPRISTKFFPPMNDTELREMHAQHLRTGKIDNDESLCPGQQVY